MRVAVAGASGSVGRALVPELARCHEVVALGRRAERRCDLFSVADTEAALEGVEVAFYLVRAAAPTERLSQASREDLDLLLADSFGRAAIGAGVGRIVYLEGARLEVAQALAAHGVPVETVRGGGSFGEALANLARRVGVDELGRLGAAAAAAAQELPSEPTLRSVQRMPLPKGRDAEWVAREYASWLPRALGPLLRVAHEDAGFRFQLRGIPGAMLTFTRRGDGVYEITGGHLAGERHGFPRLEFRPTPDGEHVLVAVQDYRPRLSWWLYLRTQARFHLWVMERFNRHLERCARPR